MRRDHRQRFQRFANLPPVVQGSLQGVLVAAVVAMAVWLGWLDGLDRQLQDSMFRLRGPLVDPSPAVVLVTVDDNTVAALNSWPVPRRYFADLVKRLRQFGARTIAFDYLFATPASNSDDDNSLVAACRDMGHVVPAAFFDVPASSAAIGSASLQPVNVPADSHFTHSLNALSNRGADCLTAVRVTSAFPDLDSTAASIGHINVYPEVDGKLRRIPHVIRFRGSLYPSLALAAATDYLGLRPHDVVASPYHLRIASRRIPINQDGETWINWVGGNNSFPTFSMIDVLRAPQFDGSVFRGRLVLIGSTASGAFEYHATPFSPAQPAMELQANAIDNILSNRPLREADPSIRWLLLVLFPVLCGALIAPRNAAAGTSFIVGLCVALLTAVTIAFAGNIYIPCVAPLLAGSLTYAAVTAVNYRREWEANWRLDAAVSTLARGGALMAEGRERSKLIGVIRRTASTALDAIEVFVVFDLPEEDFLLRETATRLVARDKSILWPSRTRARGRRHTDDESMLDTLLKQLCERVETQQAQTSRDGAVPIKTIAAAPISHRSVVTNGDDAGELDAGTSGVLIAVGRGGGGAFTPRDASLLETLAEQAGLALRNLAYYERLQGRIELANRDLRKTYQLLAEQSAKLAAAVESINDALVVTDANGFAVFGNNASWRILGSAAPELGTSVPDKLGLNGFGQVASLFDQVLSKNRDGETLRAEVRSGDGGKVERILTATLTGLQNAEGAPLGAMLVVSDVTAQRQLEQMKTDFVSYVTHELRTPLTTILGYASIIHDSGDKFPQTQRAEMAASIMTHCHRLNRMITELLDIARLDAGQPLPLHPSNFDLVELCESVMAAQRTAIHGAKQYNLRLRSALPAVEIEADRDRIEQVVTNLVSNAVKYSPEGGDVDVCVNEMETEVAISVSDKGLGIPEEQMHGLFQKFFRARVVQELGIQGTGLGLFLVKQLVESHRGSISVESTPGSGSTFTVRLPRQTSAERVLDAE